MGPCRRDTSARRALSWNSTAVTIRTLAQPEVAHGAPSCGGITDGTPTSSQPSALRELLLPMATLVLGLALGGCTIESPKEPVIETDVYVPIARQVFTGNDLSEDNEFVEGDSAGGAPLEFVIRGGLESNEIGTALDIALDPTEVQVAPQTIEVDDMEPIALDYSMAELGVPLPPGSSPVPPFTFSGVREPAPDQEGFRWMRLDGGTLAVEITNHLPVDLEPPGDGTPALGIRLWDRDGGTVIREFILTEPLGAGVTRIAEAELSGTVLTDRLDIEVWGGSPGSRGDLVEVSPDDRIAVRLETEELSADSVLARLPAQDFGTTNYIPITEDVQIESGAIREGGIDVAIDNPMPIGLRAGITFHELRRDGAPIGTTILLPPASGNGPQRAIARLDLAGCRVEREGGGIVRRLAAGIALASDPSGSEYIALGVHQTLTGMVTPSALSLDWVRGRVENREVTMQPVETAVEPPEGLEEFHFEAAELELVIENTAEVGATADVRFAGTGPSPVVLPVVFSVPMPDPGQMTRIVTTIDESNSSILDFLESRPDRIAMSGALVLSTGGRVGTVRRTDSITGSYTIRAPLRASIGRIHHKSDPFDFKVDEEQQERIREDALEMSMTGLIHNHLPVGLSARLVFAATAEDLETAPEVVIELPEVLPGTTGGSGKVESVETTPFEILLPREDFEFFARDQGWGQVVVTLHGPPGVFEVYATDYLSVEAMMRARLRSSGDR